MLILYPFLALFLTLLFIINRKEKSSQASKILPAGPSKLPIIGNLHQIGNPLHRSLHQLADKHGPLMFLQLGSIPTLIISSAEVTREVFKTHDLVFSGRPILYVANKLSYNCSDISFAPYGEYWRQVRKITILELLSVKRVQSFSFIREEEVEDMINFITSSCENTINLSKLLYVLSNKVLCRVAFGKKHEVNGRRRHQKILQEAQDLLGRNCLADFFPCMGWLNKFNGLDARLESIFKELDQFYERIIEEHLNPGRIKPEHEDLVDVLLGVQRNQPDVMSNNSVKGVLTDMFFAGTDTSSAAIVWTMSELIKNPHIMKRAQEEVRRVIKEKEKVEESDLSQLVYLKLVVKEALRLHPPAPLLVPRETTEDCEIRGYKIPAKTRVFINASSISLDPKLWDNPYDFWPDRFLNRSTDFRGQHFELIPFGVGRRGCPGINFSIFLIELALANLLYRFDWELPNGNQRDDLNMEEAFGITMHKKTPLCLVASPIEV